jgi:hypothetical protein
MKKYTVTLFTVFFLFKLLSAQKLNISVTKFRDSSESSAWCSYDSTLVAYNLLQSNGYYGIYLANVGPGNTRLNERCFTCANSSLPGKNVAQPAFQPTGKYMLFMAEKAVHAGSSANSIPGIGQYNDLWVMTMDGKKAYQLTNTPSTGISAMIEPYFNPKGTEILWASMTSPVSINGKQEFGYWVIKIAPFIDDTVNGPRLDTAHIKTILPGADSAFNEPYGWSPDGSRIIFASDYNQFWVWDDQIYTMDTNGNNIEQMTSTAHSYPYCEHAFYSTFGQYIVWMTDLDNNVGSSVGGDDWWIMNSDTTHQQRLTYFNDTTSSYWTGAIHINGHGSFCHDGFRFIGDVGGSQPVQVSPDSSIGAAYIITMNYLAGIKNISGLNPLNCKLYPNPANDFINIALSENTRASHYIIYNLLGIKILEGELYCNAATISLSNLSDGMYFLKVYNGNGSTNTPFVVEKQ